MKLLGTNFKRKTFSFWWKQFSSIFLSEKVAFPYRGNILFNECFIPGGGNAFSGQCKPFIYIFFQRLLLEKAFFLSSGNLILNESVILTVGVRFFSVMKTVTLLESFFLLKETVTAMSGNHFLKTKLILSGEN